MLNGRVSHFTMSREHYSQSSWAARAIQTVMNVMARSFTAGYRKTIHRNYIGEREYFVVLRRRECDHCSV